jgi:hypothetical protein
MAGNLPLNLIQVTQTLLLKRFTVLHDRNFNLPQLLPAEKKALELVEQNKGHIWRGSMQLQLRYYSSTVA